MISVEKEEQWVMSRRNPRHGLEPLRRALKAAGNPQENLRVIHIAGTNGKGSVCQGISDVLQAHGFHVGLFTSPHLVDHRDRIRIDGEWIGKEAFHEYLNRFMPLILENNLGMFEIDCLLAFSWFADRHTDFAVIECGLGGRLDNTNVIENPLLSIITTIGMDHMNVLGSRIEQIAFEKAGIMRPYGRTLIGKVSDEAETVIRYHGERIHARLIHSLPYYHRGSQCFSYDHDLYEVKGGQYQKENMALVLAAGQLLEIDIHDERTHRALADFSWPGRYEKVRNHPAVILDGAHNMPAMQALLESIRLEKRPLTVVFSALKDKPGKQMALKYAAASDRLIVTQFDDARMDRMENLMVPGAVCISDWKQAVDQAVQTAENGTVLITGSLHFISLVRAYLNNEDAK